MVVRLKNIAGYMGEGRNSTTGILGVRLCEVVGCGREGNELS